MQVDSNLERIDYQLTARHLQQSAFCGSSGTERPEVASTGRAKSAATGQVLDTCAAHSARLLT